MSSMTLIGRLLKYKLFILMVLIGAAYLVSRPTASALEPSPGKIPNGAKYSCNGCHVAGFYAANTQMKLDFLNATPTKTWTMALAHMDSDGDGWSNGEELQDPAGAWTIGQPDPGTLVRVSNPSQITSYPPEPVVAFTGVAGGAIINGQVTIGMEVTSGYPTELTKVVFELVNFDGDVVYTYTDTSAPFCFTAGCAAWDSTSVANDVYSLRALASDKRSAAAGGPRTIYRAAGITIDNPEPTSVEFQKSKYTASEDDGAVTVVVTLSEPSNDPVTVAYSSEDGSAHAPDDYDALDGTLTFAPGQTSASFQAVLAADSLDESEETFGITLSDPTNAQLGDRLEAEVTIQDNTTPAKPSVSIVASDPAVGEAGSDAAAFTITRSGDTSKPLLVEYVVAGTAKEDSDYASLPGSLRIPSGAASATFALTPIEDEDVEGAETVIVTLKTKSAYDVVAPSSAMAMIADDDTTPAPAPGYRILLPLVTRS
jgi:hypothetical protein